MILHQSDYHKFEFFEEKSLFKMQWNSGAEEKGEEWYKSEMLIYIELVEKHNVKFVLIDVAEVSYALKPSLQHWMEENILRRGEKAGLQKTAVIVPPDIIMELSIEQTFDEAVNSKVQRRVFGDYKEAEVWLFS
ncbi:hypothetical protein R9C00_23165 [Flammeovirgaceae bacterium SG7u.111]|nr:hypothetical protein [Flammeovirgaceae bacterium SG7u.132]WPO34606.1 hypothetical protein R9C00_23165 [Flammeovirgaceae bacterium SG7u.111]